MPAAQAGHGGIAPYHHGHLREELLRVCRNQLRTGGIDAISLRKAAQDIKTARDIARTAIFIQRRYPPPNPSRRLP
ncbi:MAG: hypothetical protein IOC80_11080 [Rhodobacter sp.]|nr:hypothetical protein [Rhodobacter sp.]MCA3515092.1 hypothetical protein [Rhodobacter sp.]MCA3521371.1 hypothetical protein [Rhodobacter sp.]MCA3521904.1 hypothetical protein [Rhodobacter sp.]MCA3524587.1 hypothetical protein [Rhodobacter sp.]